MIRKFKELDRFILVSVHAQCGMYQLIYAYIPSIKQVQCIAAKDVNGNWRKIEQCNRTLEDKIPKQFTVEINREVLTNEDVRKLYPAALEIEFSTKMIEDLKLRNPHKIGHLNRIHGANIQ